MNPTDETILIKCPECGIDEEGVNAMMSHVFDFHPNYSPAETATKVGEWAEAAHEEAERREREYTDQWRSDHKLPPIPRGIA